MASIETLADSDAKIDRPSDVSIPQNSLKFPLSDILGNAETEKESCLDFSAFDDFHHYYNTYYSNDTGFRT